jgi:hypothetical protein
LTEQVNNASDDKANESIVDKAVTVKGIAIKAGIPLLGGSADTNSGKTLQIGDLNEMASMFSGI